MITDEELLAAISELMGLNISEVREQYMNQPTDMEKLRRNYMNFINDVLQYSGYRGLRMLRGNQIF